jgi:hypothetical protein
MAAAVTRLFLALPHPPGVRYHKMSANLEDVGGAEAVWVDYFGLHRPAIDRGSRLAPRRAPSSGTNHPVMNTLTVRTAVLRREREVELGVLLI